MALSHFYSLAATPTMVMGTAIRAMVMAMVLMEAMGISTATIMVMDARMRTMAGTMGMEITSPVVAIAVATAVDTEYMQFGGEIRP